MTPISVEFAGLPGAGKTTTAQHVVELLQAPGYRCAYRPSIFGPRGANLTDRLRFLGFRFRHWRLAGAGLAYALSIHPWRWARVRTIEHLLFLAFYQREQGRSAYDIVVVDQSVIQTMWSAAIHGQPLDAAQPRALLRAFHQAAAGPTVLIVVDVDPSTAAERAVARKKGWWRARFDRLPFGEVRDVFAAHHTALTLIAEQAIHVADLRSVTIDGTAPLAANASSIADYLGALAGTAGRATTSARPDHDVRVATHRAANMEISPT